MAYKFKLKGFKGCMLDDFYICSLLLGLRSHWDKECIQLFGETWNYGDGLAGKTLEGFFESGPQLILQTHTQHLTSWPTMQPMIASEGILTKAYYFSSQKPGEPNKSNQFLVSNNQNKLKYLLVASHLTFAFAIQCVTYRDHS